MRLRGMWPIRMVQADLHGPTTRTLTPRCAYCAQRALYWTTEPPWLSKTSMVSVRAGSDSVGERPERLGGGVVDHEQPGHTGQPRRRTRYADPVMFTRSLLLRCRSEVLAA